MATIFLSHGQGDAEKATELAGKLIDAGIDCFVAVRDIGPTERWEPRLRIELQSARCLLLLLTPRSQNSTWVMIEAGAAWALEKEIVPATMFVEPEDLVDPIRSYQTKRVETDAQVVTLLQELADRFKTPPGSNLAKAGVPSADLTVVPQAIESPTLRRECFTDPTEWQQLQKVGEWNFDETSRVLSGEGTNKYLVSSAEFGELPFRMRARLRFTRLAPLNEIAAINAGLIFGWKTQGFSRRYYNLMFTGRRVLLELVGAKGGPVARDYEHLDEGVDFLIEPSRYYDLDLVVSHGTLTLNIDGDKHYQTGFALSPHGRVGLRPWRCKLESDLFEVVETSQ
jgi:hypothetical protein